MRVRLSRRVWLEGDECGMADGGTGEKRLVLLWWVRRDRKDWDGVLGEGILSCRSRGKNVGVS